MKMLTKCLILYERREKMLIKKLSKKLSKNLQLQLQHLQLLNLCLIVLQRTRSPTNKTISPKVLVNIISTSSGVFDLKDPSI
jgi:hypothetical protein